MIGIIPVVGSDPAPMAGSWRDSAMHKAEVLPQIIPRTSALFTNCFGHVEVVATAFDSCDATKLRARSRAQELIWRPRASNNREDD
jgi:hypothetical protein